MSSVEVTINGILYDKTTKGARPVAIIGTAELTGLGVGGGPIIPPEGGQPGEPPGIWGPPGPWPTPPIQMPPGTWPGQNPPHPAHPIVLPPEQVPPGMKPPTPPAPGSPVTPVPPPEGQAGWPVNPITPPAYLVLNYPGIGPVYVPQPIVQQPTPQSKK